MRSTLTYAALAATTIWASAALADDGAKRPASPTQAPNVTEAVSHGGAAVTDVGWRRRARRRGSYGYRPYSSYRPNYGGYGYGYGRNYTRPYYGRSYYGPGLGYGGRGPGIGMGLGVGPMARFGAWYW